MQFFVFSGIPSNIIDISFLCFQQQKYNFHAVFCIFPVFLVAKYRKSCRFLYFSYSSNSKILKIMQVFVFFLQFKSQNIENHAGFCFFLQFGWCNNWTIKISQKISWIFPLRFCFKFLIQNCIFGLLAPSGILEQDAYYYYH